jgi:hypothetical protein
MTRFIEGLDRSQTSLLPACIDDYVDEQSPVPAIDAFIDMLDLAELGFNVLPAATGRPGYHPATMLRGPGHPMRTSGRGRARAGYESLESRSASGCAVNDTHQRLRRHKSSSCSTCNSAATSNLKHPLLQPPRALLVVKRERIAQHNEPLLLQEQLEVQA